MSIENDMPGAYASSKNGHILVDGVDYHVSRLAIKEHAHLGSCLVIDGPPSGDIKVILNHMDADLIERVERLMHYVRETHPTHTRVEKVHAHKGSLPGMHDTTGYWVTHDKLGHAPRAEWIPEAQFKREYSEIE